VIVEIKRAADLRTAAMLFAAIVALAVIGAALPNGPDLRLAILAPAAYTIAILGDFATAVIVLSTWRHEPVRTTLVLALSFAASAVVLLLASLMLPLVPGAPPMFEGTTQTGLWLYVFWHITPAAGALAYVMVRRDEHLPTASRRFTITAVAATIAVTVGLAVAAFALAHSLPVLAIGTDVSGLVVSGIGPAAVALLAVAAFLVFRIRTPSTLDRALALPLMALTLEMTMLLVGGHRYSASYYIGRILLALAALFVLMSAIRGLIDARVHLHATERAFAELAGEASKRAGRIRALWEIASQVGRSPERIFDELLNTATAAIRPGKMMFGILSHLDNETVVIDAISWSAPESQGLRFMDTIYPGATFEIHQTLLESLVDAHEARAWDDLGSLDGTGTVWEQVGWRSFIGKKLAAGRQTYFLGFASLQPMIDQPYAEDDSAYVDVIASFFEARFSETLHYERLQFQIEHDALTGLHNRAQFRNAIRREIADGADFAIAFVNIDEFRLINERQGHMLGDEVLVEVAVTLAGVNPNNLVARMNGDEFGILLRGSSSSESIDRTLDEYAGRFITPFHTGDRDGTRLLKLSASIGAARFPDDGATPEELMRRADLALSLSKTHGGATTTVFHPSMEATLEAARVRLVELADAIASDQLALVYQPTFDLATREIVGAEALVRWDHPERGRLSPAEFVPFAERNGLISSLTRWVSRRVIRDISSGDALPKGFRVYFNVVAQTLDEFTFISELNDALRTTPDLAEHVGIELTETAAMQNIESAMHTINLLRKWGLSVAIDDFGTGYSSLSYLKKLTVDVIKIYRSFVIGLPDDERDGAITNLLLQITDTFGVATLAEGIETEAQARWLLQHGCRWGQGYLVAEPDSLTALRKRLRKQMTSTRRGVK
jgi:diguanylate cyclase (GGDEF)-like protein